MNTPFDAWVLSLRDHLTPHLDPRAFVAALGTTLDEAARIMRVHPNSISVSPHGPKVQGALHECLSVLSAAHEVCGDISRALFWFRHHPIVEFGHQLPKDLVTQGRSQELIDYLDNLAANSPG